MATPIFKPSDTWFAPTVSSINKSTITQINFYDSYTPSGTVTDTWVASTTSSGITCYVEGTVLNISGNGSGSIKANPDASRMFSYSGSDTDNSFSNLTAINGLTILDTSDCVTMERMFRSCTKITTLDISNFNTSKVKNFQMAFAVMSKLNSLDVSGLDTSACEDMGYMFYGDKFTTLNFENWDVSKVKSFDHFLTSCTSLANFDVSKWDVSSVENFNAMFHDLPKKSYDVSNWNVSNARVFSQMFEGNTRLTEIKGIENWNTSNGICFGQMFINCSALKELDLSGFDTRKAHSGESTSTNGSTSENTKDIFSGMTSLEKITLGKNFTFLGDGTSNEIGSLPATASGYWYSIDGTSYSTIPDLTYATYYSTAELAQKDLEAKKYISYGNLKTYDAALKEFLANFDMNGQNATDLQYGTVKLLPIPVEPEEGTGDFIMPDGEHVTYGDLKGYAASAFAICSLTTIFNVEVEDINNQISAMDAQIEVLRQRLLEFSDMIIVSETEPPYEEGKIWLKPV